MKKNHLAIFAASDVCRPLFIGSTGFHRSFSE